MTLIDATIEAGARSAVIAILAITLALLIRARCGGIGPAAQRWLLACGAIAYFTPGMLAGYGWLPVVTRWPQHSAARELFYAVAMVLRFTPIAALAMWLARSGPGAEARHVWHLAGGRGWRWSLRESGAAPWLAAGGVFLLAFQEFDLATSWGMRTWTVALFDAQIGGLALPESLKLAALPLLIEVAIIVPLLAAMSHADRRRATTEQPGDTWPAFAALGAAPLLFFVLVPGSFAFHLGRDGIQAWFETPGMLREIGNACISAAIAAGFAWMLTGLRRARLLLILPGLLGPLLLSLGLFAVYQASPSLGSTVWPWLIGLTLHLLPMAALLRLLVERGTDLSAIHAAELANARAPRWTLRGYRSAASLLLLFCLGYGDFTISTILAPPQFTTVFPRVFNLMHYGQSAVLSIAVFIAVLTPLVALGLTLLLLRFYVRRCVR